MRPPTRRRPELRDRSYGRHVAAVGNGDDGAAFAIYVDLMERLTGRWLGSAEGGR